MLCDFCKRKLHVTRVETWAVCQRCVSDKTVERALETTHRIAELQKKLSALIADHQGDFSLLEVAEKRLDLANEELTAAVKALRPQLRQRPIWTISWWRSWATVLTLAENHLGAAHKELSAAVEALMPLLTKATESGEAAGAAQSDLDEFEEANPLPNSSTVR